MSKGKDFFNKKYFFNREHSNYNNYLLWDNDRFWNSIINTIKKYHSRGNALDIGCAFGFLVKRMAPFFSKVYGADISEYALGKAKAQMPAATFDQLDLDVDDLPYPDFHFDLITALDVLEHTQSVKSSMKKILPKLKKDGILIISVPIKDSWAGKLFHKLDKDSTHVSVLARKDLLRIIDEVDLKIIEEKYFLNLGFMKLWKIPVDVELVLRKK